MMPNSVRPSTPRAKRQTPGRGVKRIPNAESGPVALTVGHSTLGLEEFISLLKAHGTTFVVDVRTVPRSRHNPQFNKDFLPRALKKADLGYIHLRKHDQSTAPDSAEKSFIMQAFDQVHQAVHYPLDRRFRVWINRRYIFAFAIVALIPVVIAWGQYLIAGLPTETFLPPVNLANPPTPNGFPGWLRLTHFANFFFLMLLVRSGLSILMDHPRLYWNRHCTPNSEWMRFNRDGPDHQAQPRVKRTHHEQLIPENRSG
jgi:hypothetical protein